MDKLVDNVDILIARSPTDDLIVVKTDNVDERLLELNKYSVDCTPDTAEENEGLLETKKVETTLECADIAVCTLKVIEDQTNNHSKEENDEEEIMTKFGALKQLIIVSVAFMLLFTAFLSFQSLQSTINKEEGLGTIGLSVLYGTMILTSLLIVPLTMSRFSYKWIMVVSMVTYLVYLATGFYAKWSTIIPASIIIGLGAAHLWQAQLSYVSELAKHYAAATTQSEENALGFFFGIFYSIFYTDQIVGNLASSLLFRQKPPHGTNSSAITSEKRQCGAAFCPLDITSSANITAPSTEQMYTYTGLCVGIGSVGVACMVLFLYNVPFSPRPRTDISKTIKSVIHHLVYSKKQKLLLLIPITRGMVEAFVYGDFTIAFVSCPLGVEYVGWVMIAHGVSSCIFSFLSGKISKYAGFFIPFVIAFVVQLSLGLTLLLWQPNPDKPAVIFFIAILWSIGVSTITPTIQALYSVHFKKNKDAAIATLRVLDSLGFSLSFGFSSFVCTEHKLYIIMALSTMSFVCISIFYIFEKKRMTKRNELEIAVKERW